MRLRYTVIVLIVTAALTHVYMRFGLSTTRTLTKLAAQASVASTRHSASRKMHIKSVPMWTGTGNNYAYIVTDDATKDSVVIDPANPPEVLPVLKQAIESGEINLKSIINTHHHHDHAGGNVETLKVYDVPVIGGKNCAKVTETPGHNSTFTIGKNIKVRALHTPCHTHDSICYFVEDGNDKAVFTGDTLFIGGCGRFFEGSAAEMHKALNQVLASLPDDTKVYPGHEYTKANVKFGVTVSQSEAMKKLEEFANNNKETQGKFTIGDEKRHNVFMRVEVSIYSFPADRKIQCHRA